MNGDYGVNDLKLNLTKLQQEVKNKLNHIISAANPGINDAISPLADDLLHVLELQNEELLQIKVALEKAKARYVDLYEFAPVSYLTLGEEGIIQDINTTALSLLGKKRSEVVNQSFSDFISKDFRHLWDSHFQRAKNTSIKYGCELPIQLNASNLYVHLDCLFIEDELSASNMKITLTDITERKLTEVELRIASAAFETREAIIVADADKNILRTNKAFTHITGYGAEEAKKFTFFKPDQHNSTSFREIWAHITECGYWKGELWVLHKNNEPFLISICISAIKDNDNRISNYVGVFNDITENKRLEEKFTELHRDFNAFLDNASDFIYYKDAKGRFRFCSNSLAKIAGCHKWQDMVNKDLFELFSKDVAELYRASELTVYQEGKPLLNNLEPYYDERGNKRWVSTSKWPQYDSAGEIIGIFGISRDVTDQKFMEDALKESEARYRHLLENQTEIICRFEAGGTILYANESFCRLSGMSREALVGHKWLSLIDPEDLPIVNEKLSALNPTNPICTIESRFIDKGGDIRWGQFVNQAFFDTQGNLVEMQTVGRDITEQKRAEEALRIAAVAFEAQEGILVTDMNKVILQVNKAFTQISGYSAEHVIGKTPVILHSGMHDREFYDAVQETVVLDGYWQGETWDRRKDGDVFPVLQTITAVRNECGDISHFVWTMIDITAQKHAEKVLMDTRNRLENQVVTSSKEIERIKSETEEINTALSVLLRHREMDKSEAQLAFSLEVESTVLPLLNKLKVVSKGRHQSTRIINIMESNLKLLAKSYGNAASLAAVFQQLTPVEKQVASMVRQGLSTKAIATALSCSKGTVDIHRKHIRKKLNLDGKTTNLYSYLQSLT